MVDENEEHKGSAPSHLNMLQVRVKGYQAYMSKLKGGGRSGISENFGSAEALFASPIDAPPIQILDTSTLQPSEEELPVRANTFADLIFEAGYEFAMDHTRKCSNGLYGPDVAKIAKKGIPVSQLGSAVKEISCVVAYLTALEQKILDSEEQTWQQELFGNIMMCLDKLLPDPSCDVVLGKYGHLDAELLCLKAATGFGQLLGVSEMGDLAWSATREYLVLSSPTRFSYLKQALENNIVTKS